MAKPLTFSEKLDQLISKVCEINGVKKTDVYFFKNILHINSSTKRNWLKNEEIPNRPIKFLEENYGINPAYFEKDDEPLQFPDWDAKSLSKPALKDKLIASLESQVVLLEKDNARQAEEIKEMKEAIRAVKEMFGGMREWGKLGEGVRGVLDKG